MADMKLDTAILDRLTGSMPQKTAKIVNAYGQAIASEAAQNAPVDLGALRNSITSESRMTDDAIFTVQDGVEYGIFQELGTSKMAAQPFLIPAVEKWTNPFLNAFRTLFE